MKDEEDAQYFIEGINAVVERLEPRAIVVYGSAPDYVFSKYVAQGIKIIQFDSDIAQSHEVNQ